MLNSIPEKDTNDKSSLSIGIDYFRFIVPFLSMEALQDGVEQLVHGNPYLLIENRPWAAGKGALRYPHTLETKIGINGGYGERESSDGSVYYELMIEYSGQYLERYRVADYSHLCNQVKNTYGGRCTRLDIKVDDWNEDIIPLDEMVEAYDRGDIGLFRNYQLISSQTWKKGEKVTENTHYFGSRNSGKMVRVYRHWHKDSSEHSLRYEAEFKRGRCNEIFDMLADFDWWENCKIHQPIEEPESSIAQALGAYAVGVLDFVNKSDKDWEVVNLQNCQRLPFWQKFIDAIGGFLRIKPPVRVTSLADRMEWFVRQGGKTLLIMYQGLGTKLFGKQINSILSNALDRFTSEDELMVAQLKQDRERNFDLPFTVGDYSPTMTFYAF